ncbi:MAG: LAGLIDADG family homing endonuclease [Candidatus Woesearchaeota archaeon]
MIIETYDILAGFDKIYIKISYEFFNKLKIQILNKYKSLKEYNKKRLKINYSTLKLEFKTNNYHSFQRILKIINDININKNELYDNIKGFYYLGSHKKQYTIIPKEIVLNEQFIEGYALYLAEGDTGFNGKTRPRKLRFTNSDLSVIKLFLDWVKTYLPSNYFYLKVIMPQDGNVNMIEVRKYLGLNQEQLRVSRGYYNKIIKYRLCVDNAIIIDLFLSIHKKIKKIVINDKELIIAYIRGMMIGEGTAYFNRSRYVRIEMRNEREIRYLNKLFLILGYQCEPSLRTTRKNMWSLYIGAKQLRKYYEEIGFGVLEKRQKILENAVNKKLRVNQYC